MFIYFKSVRVYRLLFVSCYPRASSFGLHEDEGSWESRVWTARVAQIPNSVAFNYCLSQQTDGFRQNDIDHLHTTCIPNALHLFLILICSD